MTQSKHTPGPWHVNPLLPMMVNHATGSIARVSTQLDSFDANASLISAAPDMLTALEEAGMYIGTAIGAEGDDEAHRVYGIIYAAIAKARS